MSLYFCPFFIPFQTVCPRDWRTLSSTAEEQTLESVTHTHREREGVREHQLKSFVVIHLLELISWLCNFLNIADLGQAEVLPCFGSSFCKTYQPNVLICLQHRLAQFRLMIDGLGYSISKTCLQCDSTISGSGGIPLFLVKAQKSEKHAFVVTETPLVMSRWLI